MKHGGESVMVWGCFSEYEVRPLHRMHNEQIYVYLYINNIMEPFAHVYVPLRQFYTRQRSEAYFKNS